MLKKTIKNFIKKNVPLDGDDLADISDKIWKFGNLDTIKKKVSPDLFTIHIAINMIGIWQGDGWYGIIGDNPTLIPYISETLDKLDLLEIKEAFQKVISLFPDFTVFDDSKDYCNIINFLTNVRMEVGDERLKQYSKEERTQMSEEYHRKMEVLDGLSESVWNDDAEEEGWEAVLKYIHTHIENI